MIGLYLQCYIGLLMSISPRVVAVCAIVSGALILSANPMADSPAAPQKKASASVAGYRVVKIYPHDRMAFTQGLQYVDGVLYEGTGQNGQSGIRKVELETGKVLQHQPLDAKYFGEGITVWQNTIVQITWQSEIGFVYDKASFKQLKSFSYTGEGWGLTHDGTRLIMSDGTSLHSVPRPGDLQGIRPCDGEGQRRGDLEAERARVREGRDRRQRLADLAPRRASRRRPERCWAGSTSRGCSTRGTPSEPTC